MGVHLLRGGVLSIFDTQGVSLCICRQGGFPWPQEWSSYLFTSTKFSFCHWLCPWTVWVRTKLQFYSTWQIPAVQPRGTSIFYLSIWGWEKHPPLPIHAHWHEWKITNCEGAVETVTGSQRKETWNSRAAEETMHVLGWPRGSSSMNNMSTHLCVFHIDLYKYLKVSWHSPPALSPFCFM